jgi:hypothetical protein
VDRRFSNAVNATTDERNDDMKPTKFTNEAELKALFDHAVRAIGFYEAQRKEVLMALESLGRAVKNRPPKASDAVETVSATSRLGYAPGRRSFQDVEFATSAPQTNAVQFGEWRISAGFSEIPLMAKLPILSQFISVTIG